MKLFYRIGRINLTNDVIKKMIIILGIIFGSIMLGYLVVTKLTLVLAFFALGLIFLIPIFPLYTIMFLAALFNVWLPAIVTFGSVDVRIFDGCLFFLIIRIIGLVVFRKVELSHTPAAIRWFWLFLAFCILSLMKAYWTVDWNQSTIQTVTFFRWVSYAMFFNLAPYVLTTSKRINLLIYWVCISLFAQAIYSLFTISGDVFRASGFGSTADYAVAITLLIAIIYGSFQHSSRLKLIKLLLLGFGVTSLLLTFTRAAFLVFILVTFLFFLTSKRNKSLLFITTSSVCLIGGIVYWNNLQTRLMDTLGSEGSAQDRISLIKLSLSGVWNDLLLGKGWSSFRFWNGELLYNSNGFSDLYRYTTIFETHSGYMQFLFDGGIIGFVLFVFFLIASWKMIKKASNHESLPVSKAAITGIKLWFLGICLWLLFDQLLPSTLASLYFWLALGIAFAMYNLNNKAEDTTVL